MCACGRPSSFLSKRRSVTMSVNVAVGDTFNSYSDLELFILTYERENHVQLTLRDTRTLDNARSRAPKRVEGSNPRLKYYSVHYTCVCGGKKYFSKGNGIRTGQRLVWFILDSSGTISVCRNVFDGESPGKFYCLKPSQP